MQAALGCDPIRAFPTDAGADLSVQITTILPKGVRVLVPTGVKVSIPEGYVGLLVPRSSISKTHITMANSVGVIDSTYRGMIMAALVYDGPKEEFVLDAGVKIVQLLIMPVALPHYVEVVHLAETVRGESGFGSTGNTV